MANSLTSFWETYESEDSFLPLYVPLIIWIAAFLYSKWNKQEFHRWYTIHNLHNGGAIALGLVSMYYNDDSVFNERIPILWSIGYFVVDLVDCGLRGDVTYSLHAAFCLVLGVSNYTTPVCRELRMNSKASLCEMSNPFMHLAKTTRNSAHFLLFGAVFTICRIVWIPYLMFQLVEADMAWTDFRLICLLAFYGLNWFWYYKILGILVQGIRGESKEKEVGNGDAKAKKRE